jgi:hypothetical protein
MSRGDQYHPLFAAYHTHCHIRDDDVTSNDIRRRVSNESEEALQLVPVVVFITELTRHNQSACQAALTGGFLDMLLRIYVAFPLYKAKQKPTFSLLTACQSALVALSADALHVDMVCNHPVYDLWLCGNQLAPCYIPRTPEEILEDRCAAWRRTKAHLVKRRLMTICSVSTRPANDDAKSQACADDVVEFSR